MPTASAVAEPVSTPAVQPIEGEQRFLIHGVTYGQYVQLLAIFGDDGPRITYADGVIELMSPGPIHEQWSDTLGFMVRILILELAIPAKAQASTTFRQQDRSRGLEPDRCFYLASLRLLQGRDLQTLNPLPPPDLVIEVEVTAPLLDKLQIYASLGVPEIWRHNQEGLVILCLGPDGQYHQAGSSRVFPFLPVAEFCQHVEAYDPDAETAWSLAYRAWVRDVVLPLSQA